MTSLVIVGEYDEMKYLVRDGSKKLQEAAERLDDSLFAVNRTRGETSVTPNPLTTVLSPRKRASPNYSVSECAAALKTNTKLRSGGLPQSAPPKLKSHPRDRPTSRKNSDENTQNRDSTGIHGEAERTSRQSTTTAGDGDWSNALSFSRGYHSIWNCGGTGEETGTVSSPQVVSTCSEPRSPALELSTGIRPLSTVSPIRLLHQRWNPGLESRSAMDNNQTVTVTVTVTVATTTGPTITLFLAPSAIFPMAPALPVSQCLLPILRGACNPSVFWDIDRYFYGLDQNPCQNRRQVLEQYCA
jgi:hypothetical protein